MARKIRINKKKFLKQPDEFISMSGKVIQFFRQRERLSLSLVSAMIIIILIISFAVYYLKKNNSLGFNYLAKALSVDNQLSQKKESLIKIRKMRYTNASNYAAFYLSQIYLNENRPDLAKIELKDATKINDQYIRGAADSLMIDVLIKEKKYDEAQSLALNSSKTLTSPFKEELLFKQGLIYELQNKPSEAKNIYYSIKKTYPDFYMIKVVDEKIGTL